MFEITDEITQSIRARNRLKKKLWKNRKRLIHGFDPADHDTAQRLCMAALRRHEYHWAGWEHRNSWARDIITKPWVYPPWDGKKRRVLVLAEQGLGDEILWASCYEELSRDVEEAWIEADTRLIPIFERSFPSNLHFISRFLNDERRVLPKMLDYPEKTKEYPIECFIPSGNVPPLYRRDCGDFVSGPYLLPDSIAVDQQRDWLRGQDRLVGALSWHGRQGQIPTPAGPFASVQYGLQLHKSPYPKPPIDLKMDIEGVFAFLAAIGRCVSVPNTVAHMAGAIGIPTDVIIPAPIMPSEGSGFNNRVNWQWPNDNSDWYSSITIFRNIYAWENKRAKLYGITPQSRSQR